MTEQQQHPITSPPGLAMRFRGVPLVTPPDCVDPLSWIAERTYQMGADQELDACCEEMESLPLLEGSGPLGIPFGEMASNALRAVRRPEPPPRPTKPQADN